MTAQQAKQILLAYRPWTDDAQDDEVAKAIAVCQQDAELNQWFENHCAAQTAIRDHFRAVPIPDGLRQQIISEYKSETVSMTWWRRPAVLTPVAMAVLLVAIVSLWFSLPHQQGQNVGFTGYRNRMMREVVKSYAMDLETNDGTQIRTYLAQHQSPADYVLPTNLQQAQTVGCGTLSWQGKPVSMVCFRTGKPLSKGAKSDLFLFVINQNDLSDPPQGDSPVFANVSMMATATWKAEGKVYLLAAPNADALQQHL